MINKYYGAAHLFDGKDTLCRMYSTGGLNKKKMVIVDNQEDRELCSMCSNVYRGMVDTAETHANKVKMVRMTPEWIESIQDEHGLTRGQVQLLDTWEKRIGPGQLPEQVANFIAKCKGYRGVKEENWQELSRQHANRYLKKLIQIGSHEAL